MATDTEKKLLLAMGQRAKARREELGLTLNEVAVRMGRTYQCIYGMEKEGSGSLRVVLEWAEALKMPALQLAFGETVKADGKLVDWLREAAKLIDSRRGRRRELVRQIREEIGE